MRKNILSTTMAAILCISALSGCQKAPEASDDGDVHHAQSSLEQQILDIAGGNAGETAGGNTAGTTGQQSGGFYEGTIGTGDNKIRISAQIPAVPENVYRITLKPNESLDMESLTAFLDSPGGRIEDTSQALLDELAQSEYDNTHDDEQIFYSVFADHSAMRITDGKRTAGLRGHTSASYLDPDLRDLYFANVQTSTEITVGQTDAGTAFPLREAEEILLDKLKALGITEVAFTRIILNEGKGYSFYFLDFVPSYGGTSLIRDIGSGYTLGELYPWGGAAITPEGVAMLDLMDFCGKIAEKEPVSVLSFEQVEKVLEQYLDSGRIQGDERLTLDNIALEYYPVPNLSPAEREIEYKSELELIPIWHIYMSLDDYVEMHTQGDGLDDALYNICINAVTGKIERVS